MTLEIDILNPKARELLQNLADMKLISIKDMSDEPFIRVLARIRKKAGANAPTLEEITKEVEIVRSKRYAQKKK